MRIRDLATASPIADTDYVVLDNGTTRKAAVSALRSALLAADERTIWEWNETDVTQFGSAVGFTGLGTGTAPVIEVYQHRGKNALKLRLNSGAGGWLFPILNLTPPNRYRIEYDVVDWDAAVTANTFLVTGLGYKNAGGTIDGLITFKSYADAAANSHDMGFVIADAMSGTTLDINPGSSFSDAHAVHKADGGIRVRFDVLERQAGQNPQTWSLGLQYEGARGAGTGRRRSSTSSGLPGLTGWNGLSFDLVGIGTGENSVANDRYYAIRNFRIRELP